jgi:hypothetical protein
MKLKCQSLGALASKFDHVLSMTNLNTKTYDESLIMESLSIQKTYEPHLRGTRWARQLTVICKPGGGSWVLKDGYASNTHMCP